MRMMKKNSRTNKEISAIFFHIAQLLEISSVPFKPAAYRRAARVLEEMKPEVRDIYAQKGASGLQEIAGIGESMAAKIEEFLNNKKIAFYEGLKEKTALREIVTHFFQTKGLSLATLKKDARKQKIVYARYTAPAKQLLELAGSVEKAKETISIVADWANSRKLDYSIETVFKKWLELDRLKPKEIVKKPFYEDNPMVWSEAKKKWFVVTPHGEWLEFADSESKIKWKIPEEK